MDLVGARIKAVRSAMKMTVDGFAKFIGVSKGTLIHYEKNETRPDVTVAKNIVEKCEVNADWLITGKGEMSYKISKDVSREQLLKKLFPDTKIDATFLEIIEILSDPAIAEVMVHEFKIAYLYAPKKYPNLFPNLKTIPTATGG